MFAGIGGFDLAARWMGWETAWVSEIDPYASAVLKKHFPDAPNLGDIRHIDGTTAPAVDMLCGGFPCQDISLAGRGAGIGGSRSGLWKEFARLIGEIRPRYIVAENVPALRKRGLDVVLNDLAALGYDAEWHCIPASATNAPHQRDRIWIVAYAARIGVQGLRPSGIEESHAYAPALLPVCGCERLHASDWEAEPNVGRVVDGLPNRVDRISCLGNAIVPQVAFQVFQGIARHVEAE